MMLNGFWRRRDDAPATARRADTGARDDIIRVLALTRDADEWNSLHAISDAEKWILLWAHTSERAKEIIARYRVPVVICDRDLPNEDWRRVISDLATVRPPVCTLLASEVSDEYLWREVVQNHGFEILVKPFDRERVARTIRFAANTRGLTLH
jgi:DNA-binding NtrC family response regulator